MNETHPHSTDNFIPNNNLLSLPLHEVAIFRNIKILVVMKKNIRKNRKKGSACHKYNVGQ